MKLKLSGFVEGNVELNQDTMCIHAVKRLYLKHLSFA